VQEEDMRARVQATFIVIALCGAQSVVAQTYPTRTIRMVVASSPGGGSDILARLVSPKLGDAFGQQVVVENRAGASGIIGVDAVAKSAPDGYTLILTQTSLAINPAMFPKMP
jgi:tripartite-type tricarboxylate transporter receptor subunit TctC